jgi:hypothetical protein
MNTEQRLLNRVQLKQCFVDLGNRAEELGEHAIKPICLVIAGTIAEGSDEMLADWMAEYAKLRISLMDSEDEDFQNKS